MVPTVPSPRTGISYELLNQRPSRGLRLSDCSTVCMQIKTEKLYILSDHFHKFKF